MYLTKEAVARLRPNNNTEINTLIRILKHPANLQLFLRPCRLILWYYHTYCTFSSKKNQMGLGILCLADIICFKQDLCRGTLSARYCSRGVDRAVLRNFLLPDLSEVYTTKDTVRPSRIGSSTVSTLGSSLSNLLYSSKILVALSLASSGATTLPDHKTLSDKITLPFLVF